MITAQNRQLSAVIRMAAAILPVLAISLYADTQGSTAAGEEAKGTVVAKTETAASEATAKGAAAGAKEEIVVGDPDTGGLKAVLSVTPDRWVKLPPGEIKCSVMKADGVTPHGKVKLSLADAKTGKEVVSGQTDENGQCVLKDVVEGRYVVALGNPGFVGLLEVSKAAKPGLLSIVLSESAKSPFPAWAPDWMHKRPVLATAVVTAAGTTLVVAPIAYIAGQDDEHISPIVP